MILRLFACALIGLLCRAAGDSVAARLAGQAREAQNSGQLVRAYLLYAEAAARDPKNSSYGANRDALEPAAKLLTKANVQREPDVSSDIQQAEDAARHSEPPVELASERAWEQAQSALHPYPHPAFDPGKYDFNLRGDERSIIERVAAAYGLSAMCDPDLRSESNVHLEITGADFRTAMEALTEATNTFVFPTSDKVLYFAPDTQAKRDELEPMVLLTFPLPEALDQKDLIEAATAVRGVLNMRAIGWDSATRMVLIRDRARRAQVARALLEAVLLPKAQVSFDVQFITVDSDISYHYGVSLPTVFQLINFGHLGRLQSILPSGLSGNFLTFGGGATLFGIGLTDATLFASYSKAFSRILFDATVVVGDRQTASLHIGDQYPIQTTIYSGAQQSAGSIYNPIGQVTMEDLGLVLKLTPRINGEGEVSLDLEADYKALGTQVYDTIPAIAEREFKGTITMREDQWAVIAGLEENTQSITKNGFLGLGQIPGLDQILSEHTRETKTENLLLVIKPTLKTLPMSAAISPQYLLGPERGERVLM